MEKDYYKILNVDKNSTQDEIKKSYRKLSKKYHPDVSKDPESESKFKEISEAYGILGDQDKRSSYDRFGSGGNPFGNPFGGQGHGFSHDDIFSQFGDIFGAFGKTYGGTRKQRGNDLRMKVNITIDDVLNGITKKIKYKRQDKCNTCSGKGGTDVRDCIPCNGTGRRIIVQNTPFGQMRQEAGCPDCVSTGKMIKNTCIDCNGSGTITKEEIVDIEIPPGVEAGMQLTMKNLGNYTRDGLPGDLNIIIDEIKEHYFRREKNNLIIEKEISVIDAIIGADVKVKTPHGELNVNIDAGTNHDSKIRINGKGTPHVHYGLGDLYVIVKVKMPKNINKEDRIILDKLRESESFK
jgi:molecular chaperone DnaJ